MADRAALRILLVENHPDTAKYLQWYLLQNGCEVSLADSLEAAVSAVQETSFDFLLSDIGLPDGDGWELLERMGARRPPFAVAMSGYGSSKDAERSRLAGFRHHLLKPFDPVDLERLLQEAAANRNRQG